MADKEWHLFEKKGTLYRELQKSQNWRESKGRRRGTKHLATNDERETKMGFVCVCVRIYSFHSFLKKLRGFGRLRNHYMSILLLMALPQTHFLGFFFQQ